MKRKRKKKELCCLINPHEQGKKCRECLVRSRRSYSTFKYIASSVRTMEDVLVMVWAERDSCRGWRSQQTATKVRESIAQLTKDFGLDKIKIDVPKDYLCA